MPALMGLADAEPDRNAIVTRAAAEHIGFRNNMLVSCATPNHAGTALQTCPSTALLTDC